MKILLTIFISAIFFINLNGQIIFQDNFDSGVFSSEWTLNPSIQGTNGVIDIQNVGISGTGGVRMGRAFDSNEFTTNALDLQLDLSNENDIYLTFSIFSNDDVTHDEDGLYFSNDLTTFVKVLDFAPQSWCDNAYGMLPPIDVDKLATEFGLNPFSETFVIRFQQHGQDDFSGLTSSNGLYIDNVTVYNPQIEYKAPPIIDDFNSGFFNNWWTWEFADNSILNQTETGLTTPSNVVDIQDGVGVNGTSGVRMGRRCDGFQSVNALDLHLDLSEIGEYLLTFDIRSNEEELNDPDDGLYLSDDSGSNFVKVLDFLPQRWCQNAYGANPPINISRLAEENQLNPQSSNFIVRFQQRGQNDFVGLISSGGFFIDNVSVKKKETEYKIPPIMDDFNSGIFPNWWLWGFADGTITNQTEIGLTTPSNVVDIQNGIGIDGTTAVRLGRRCDGFPSVNALDLYVNLSNQENFVLTFSMLSNEDEADVDDGLYLSVDGGQNFSKITEFDFQGFNSYEFFEISISDFADDMQLELTEETIIRFQQRGVNDFVGIISSGGFYLDNVGLSMVTSVNETLINQIVSISPNPTSDWIQIDFPNSPEKLKSVELYDVIGRKVHEDINLNEFDRWNIDLPKENGMYILKLQFGDGNIVSRKVIKN